MEELNATIAKLEKPDERIVEVLQEIGTMLLSEKDFKRCPSDFASRLGSNISIEGSSAVTDGGFILKYGDVEINCTLGALFTAYADELKAKASEILFG